MNVPVATTVAYLAERERALAARLGAQVATLRARAPEAAELLRQRFGAAEVWLFGSLVDGDFHEASDVDLAVRGLAWSDFADAHDAMLAWFGRPVDLVALESAAPSLVAKVERRGLRL